MAIVFDPASQRIILDSVTVTATELYSRWCDWLATGDNTKYLPAFRAVGGDDLGSGLSIPPYFFLTNGWRVRPLEADHTLTLTGNLFVEGGGDPVVKTLGDYNVLVKSVVPVQAQGISTSGTTVDYAAVASAVWAHMARTLTANPGITAGDVVTALESTTLQVDAVKMNGGTIYGDGSEADPWRGVGVAP